MIGNKKDEKEFESKRNSFLNLLPTWFIEKVDKASNIYLPTEEYEKLAKDKNEIVRMVVANNISCPVSVLRQLMKDKDSEVCFAVTQNPNTTKEMLDELANHSDKDVRFGVILNEKTSKDTVENLAKDSDILICMKAKEKMNSYQKNEDELKKNNCSVWDVKLPNEEQNKKIMQKVISVFESWRIIEFRDNIICYYLFDEDDESKSYEQLKDSYNEETLERYTYKSYSELLYFWLDDILNDMNELGVSDEKGEYAFYLDREEINYIGYKEICNNLLEEAIEKIEEDRFEEGYDLEA